MLVTTMENVRNTPVGRVLEALELYGKHSTHRHKPADGLNIRALAFCVITNMGKKAYTPVGSVLEALELYDEYGRQAPQPHGHSALSQRLAAAAVPLRYALLRSKGLHAALQ